MFAARIISSSVIPCSPISVVGESVGACTEHPAAATKALWPSGSVVCPSLDHVNPLRIIGYSVSSAFCAVFRRLSRSVSVLARKASLIYIFAPDVAKNASELSSGKLTLTGAPAVSPCMATAVAVSTPVSASVSTSRAVA